MALTAAFDWVKRLWTRRSGRGMKLLSGVGILLILGLAAALLIPWPWVLNHHEEVRNLGLVVAGMIALPLAVWRALVAEHQARVAADKAETARRSLLNERDQKAAEMLGSALLSVRLGGIYALQTLAAEHPPHYHLGVMRQFCAFVRNPPSPPPNSTAAGLEPVPVGEDVRAVMNAIGARSDAGIAIEQEEKGFMLDLVGVNLSGVNLRKAKLSGADFRKADLSGADFRKADLRRANLSEADLTMALVHEADLSGAYLLLGTKLSLFIRNANLSRVSLTGANLSGMDFLEANLHGAHLDDADLSGARLEAADLRKANLRKANLSGVNLRKAKLSEADLRDCNVSSARFSADTVITQEQLDQTLAEPPEKPPIFEGKVRDAKTGDPLEWRGPTA